MRVRRLLQSVVLSILLLLSALPSANGVAALAPPRNVRIVTVGVGSLTVAWSRPVKVPADFQNYQLQYSADLVTWTNLQNFPPLEVTATVITGLEAGKRYGVRVRSQAEAADSAWEYALPSSGIGLSQLSLDAGNACGITTNGGHVYCWGYGVDGQLGNGSSQNSTSPVAVAPSRRFTDVEIGGYHACAVEVTGKVFCWGANDFGQLGNNSLVDSNVPVAVGQISDAISVAIGDAFSCVLRATGEVSCWGSNLNGQLAEPVEVEGSSSPVDIGLSNVAEISAGLGHACALSSSQSLKCWGVNAAGQLGDGTTTTRRTPTAVALASVASLAIGANTSCATLADKTIKCWGSNTVNWLWPAPIATSLLQPTAVSGVTDAESLSLGSAYLCAVRASGAVKCLGSNYYGQFGIGSRSDLPLTWTDVPAVHGARQLASGGADMCFVDLTGRLRCAGNNWYGTHTVGEHNEIVSTFRSSDFFVGYDWKTPDKPGAVTAITKSFPKAKSAVIGWTAVADNASPVTKYSVSWRAASASTFGAWKSAGTKLTFTVPGLKKGVKYFIRVQATNLVGSTVSKAFAVTPTK